VACHDSADEKKQGGHVDIIHLQGGQLSDVKVMAQKEDETNDM
jgi:hypothetical protein